MKKKILITGSTDGIGKLVALQLAKEGHTVHVHGRSKEKVDALLKEVRALGENEEAKGFVADLSDLNAVRHMAREIQERVPELDVLINNAGVFNSPVALNKEGQDLRIVVNYLAPYLLTNELLPLLRKSNEPRIINLSSAAQKTVDHKVLSGEKMATTQATYAQSKLALTMWSFYLAKAEPNILVIAVNPGSLLNTKMAIDAYGTHWAPANKGSDILYKLAISDEFKGLSGKYYDNDRGAFGPPHADARDEEKVKGLIELTDQLLKTSSRTQ